MGYIYAHVNKTNQKKYIGQAINIEDRWMFNGYKYKTCPRFWSTLQSYGWDEFDHIILEEVPDKLMDERECYWIHHYNTTNPEYGYNLTTGGTGGDTFHTLPIDKQEEWREKCRKHNETRGEEWHKKLSEAQKKAWAEGRRKSTTPKNNPACSKPVECIETGKIYPSCAEAVEDCGFPRSAGSRISRVCNGKRKTWNKQHWRYYNG